MPSNSCASRLQIVLAREMAWRRRELVAAYLGIPPEEWQAKVYCRQAVLLLYAHIEGFVKFSATQYLRVIGDSGIPSSELCPELLGLAINSEVLRAVNQSSPGIIGAVIHRVIDDPKSLPSLSPKNAIKTKANLSSRRLRSILGIIGLDRSYFASYESRILDRLLRWRNGIAHGQGIPIDRADYRLMHHGVLDFLDSVRTYLEESAASEKYRR